MSTEHDRDGERGGFFGFSPRPTKRQASALPVRLYSSRSSWLGRLPYPSAQGVRDAWFYYRCGKRSSPVGEGMPLQLALESEGEVRAQAPLRDEPGAALAAAIHPMHPGDPFLADEIALPLMAVVISAHAASRWLAADPPNIERARAAAERIIRDANAAVERIARLQNDRRLHSAERAKGDD